MLKFTKEQQERFDKWNKEDIYIAYLTEYEARKKLNAEVNDLRRKIAEIKHLFTRWMENIS